MFINSKLYLPFLIFTLFVITTKATFFEEKTTIFENIEKLDNFLTKAFDEKNSVEASNEEKKKRDTSEDVNCIINEFTNRMENNLEGKEEVNKRDEDGNTPLMIAVMMRIKEPKIVEILLEKGADPRLTNPSGFTAFDLLRRSIRQLPDFDNDRDSFKQIYDSLEKLDFFTNDIFRQISRFKDYVEFYGNLNLGDNAHVFCTKNVCMLDYESLKAFFIKKIKNLIKNNKSLINKKNQNGMTLLMFAAQAGFPSIINLLLKAGANPTTETLEGFTASDYVNKSLSSSEKLISKGLFILRNPYKKCLKLLDIALNNGKKIYNDDFDFLKVDFSTYNLDCNSCYFRFPFIVCENLKNKEKLVLADVASLMDSLSEVKELLFNRGFKQDKIEKIMNKEIDRSLKDIMTGLEQNTRFLEFMLEKAAIEIGSIFLLKKILSCNVNVNVQDDSGNTILHNAALYCGSSFYSVVEVIDCLIEHGADSSIKNDDGETVFDILRKFCKEYGNDKRIDKILLSIISEEDDFTPCEKMLILRKGKKMIKGRVLEAKRFLARNNK